MLWTRVAAKVWWLVLVATVGCRQGTAVVVRVDARDLAIPAQLAALHIRVSNPELPSSEPVYDVVGSTFAQSSQNAYQMESMDVTRAGSWLVSWIGKLAPGGCTRAGKPPTFDEANASIEEIPDLEVGPTGVRRYDCPVVTATIGAELLLVP